MDLLIYPTVQRMQKLWLVSQHNLKGEILNCLSKYSSSNSKQTFQTI